MSTIRIVHFLNQFFAGIGDEDRADLEPGVKEGALGPGRMLQEALEGFGEVVATVYCGDNFANEHQEKSRKAFATFLEKYRPQAVVAGPAFNSGRYGLACGLFCATAQEVLGIPAVSAMFPNNPAVEIYRSQVYIVPTSSTALGMPDAMARTSKLALKMAQNRPIGSSQEEGYLSRGLRYNRVANEEVGVRSVEMLMNRLHDLDFQTEWPVPRYDRVPPAAPLEDLQQAHIAIVTSGGVVPRGNRDRLESARATKWRKYSIAGVSSLSSKEWECVHGGFDTTSANQEPNRVVPLDVLRELETQGVFASLADEIFITTGNQVGLENAVRFGEEVAAELVKAEVDGVIFVAP